MLIINKQCRFGERIHQWRALACLPHNGGQFLTNTQDQQLLITSKQRVLRPSSDNSKGEKHDILIHAHRQKSRINANISEQTQD